MIISSGIFFNDYTSIALLMIYYFYVFQLLMII